MTGPARRPNHLLGQTSPYLLQHLYNPVDWRPWSEEALELARRDDRPVLLSIGYAACHWCHVMERESFENDEIAGFLNRHFVPIKVDREERPDLDEIYMNAVQLMTRQGGWPLNVFLMPDGRPFTGGTYFPPESRWGRIGFLDLLRRIHELWTTRREEVERAAADLRAHLVDIGRGPEPGAAGDLPGRAEAAAAAAQLATRFDDRRGGFGGAPKFPPDGSLALLLLEHRRTGEPAPLGMARATLDAMARGGIYDHVGGGFARYSVDEAWLVPHFEKMLYTQALLVPLYVDAFTIEPRPAYRRVVEQTLDFVRRELTSPEGGFLSSLDADSEGEEGRYYVWTPEEIDAVLGPADGALFREVYDVAPDGNFEGRSIPNLVESSLAEHAERRGLDEDELERRLRPLRARLLDARERRPRPATDDKVLTAWNGLAITAFARAARSFGRAGDVAAARSAAEFVLREMLRDGRLRVSWRAGTAALNGHLDDYAFLARGLVDLWETTFERRWLDAAASVARTLVARFEDRERGGFWFTSDDHEEILTRNRSVHDGALPAGAGVACETLLRLAALLDDDGLRAAAERALSSVVGAVRALPSACASTLVAADRAAGPPLEVALVGEPDDRALAALRAEVERRYLPRLVLAGRGPDEPDDLPLLRGRDAAGGRPTAWVCVGGACRPPITDAAALGRALDEETAPP